jgi:hypothetical protein
METWTIKLARHVDEATFRARWESSRRDHPNEPEVEFTFLEGDVVRAQVHPNAGPGWAPGDLFKVLEALLRQPGSRN